MNITNKNVRITLKHIKPSFCKKPNLKDEKYDIRYPEMECMDK